jgi:glycosyltransferase involved in cell wall biosynthesis
LKVSVYIPTRNRVDLLAAAVRSVLAQQFTDLELIVVDDASTDGTVLFLESITREDRRVRALRNESPRGAPASRNKAITQATGDFITGLDDDDTFEPQRLSALHDCWASYARHDIAVSCIYTQDVFLSGGKELFVTKKGEPWSSPIWRKPIISAIRSLPQPRRSEKRACSTRTCRLGRISNSS